jgi:hypothetical protein
MEYRGYKIMPKQDFGSQPFLIKGEWVKSGFNVIDKNGCNAMPGATWFRTTIDAKEAIDALILSRDNAEIFWLIMGNGGGSEVCDGKSGRIKVEPYSHPVTYSANGFIRVDDQIMTPVEALAFSSALRRAALIVLGDD